MSKTGGPLDQHMTPPRVVRQLLREWKPPGGLWVEPGAGSGNVARVVLEMRPDVDMVVVEKDERFYAELGRLPVPPSRLWVHMGDWLTDAMPPQIDRATVVIGNPPYSKGRALAFLQEARLACPRAHVAFLLPLSFFGSRKRAAWLRRHAPDLWGVPDRPEFSDADGSAYAEYAWFIWPPAVWGPRAQGISRVLAPWEGGDE